MRKKTNQEIERYYFKKFYKQYPLPRGKIVYHDKPDVMIWGEIKTGIEITRFYGKDGSYQSSEQQQRNRRLQTVKLAHQLYREKTGKHDEFRFGFNPDHPIGKNQPVAENIAEYCAYVKASQSGMLARQDFAHIPELDSVYFNAKDYAKPRWRVNQVHDIPVMSLASLQEFIRRKEAKSQAYEKCDVLWLLVIIDFMDPAQEREIEIEGLDQINSKVFEKIILFKTVFDTINEIKSKWT